MRKLMACLVALMATAAANADVIVFSHTWTGGETSGPSRLNRNGIPSTAPVPKPFPGTFPNNPSLFYTQTIMAAPGSVVTVDTTSITPQFTSHLSAYGDQFDPLNLSQNYLGDQGSSLLNTFSFLAPASGKVVLVAQTNFQPPPINGSFAANVTFTPAPEPLSLLVFGGLVVGGGLVARRRLKAKV